VFRTSSAGFTSTRSSDVSSPESATIAGGPAAREVDRLLDDRRDSLAIDVLHREHVHV
jgi:hypothetical protein